MSQTITTLPLISVANFYLYVCLLFHPQMPGKHSERLLHHVHFSTQDLAHLNAAQLAHVSLQTLRTFLRADEQIQEKLPLPSIDCNDLEIAVVGLQQPLALFTKHKVKQLLASVDDKESLLSHAELVSTDLLPIA